VTTQALLKSIDSKIKKSKSPFVVLPLEEWQQIEDVICELFSPQLLKSIRESRKSYKKAKSYKEIRKSLLK
jgi:PHD/YefM family antitoxin component YafN of YafNO toxin-antitoxin module